MKKKLISAFFLLTMLVTSAFAVDLYVDGSQLTPDVPPTIVSGRTLVPLRSIFEALNADVQWDQATRTATATKADTTVQVTLNQKTPMSTAQRIHWTYRHRSSRTAPWFPLVSSQNR